MNTKTLKKHTQQQMKPWNLSSNLNVAERVLYCVHVLHISDVSRHGKAVLLSVAFPCRQLCSDPNDYKQVFDIPSAQPKKGS